MNDERDGPKYYGKYRGLVLNNIDLQNTGRIQVQVENLPIISTWALPCVPIAGIQSGVFLVPAIGSKVWVEFEQGDLNYPIWVGGFWGSMADVPALALVPPPPPGQNFCLQTAGQNTLLISDVPGPTGGFILKTLAGATVMINDATGITIQNGKGAVVTMTGPTITLAAPTINITGGTAVTIAAPTVSINPPALVVI